MDIEFVLNRHPCRVQVRPEMTALELLREQAGLTGTKEGCNEGDCGACTIVLGRLQQARMRYRAVNACLMPAARLHGAHVVTIEGLAEDPRLHPIQQAVLERHATQCGFCTPGVIMSLFALFLESPSAGPEQIKQALEGNLCRCTGYASIHGAAQQVIEQIQQGACVMAPAYFEAIPHLLGQIAAPAPHARYLRPASLDALFEALERLAGRGCPGFLAGGTDLMVERNLRGKAPDVFIDLQQLPELNAIACREGWLSIGAMVPLSVIAADAQLRQHLPQLGQTVLRMGSQQTRNVATLGGNIGNASPVADAATLLLALDARLLVASRAAPRRLPLADYYLGYKQTACGAEELIQSIEIPLRGLRVSFEKSAKRRFVDIASVNSALALGLEGGRIAEARLAIGGVAPTPVLLQEASRLMIGKRICPALAERVAQVAARQVAPISDVRGGAPFRRDLVHNQIVRHCMRLSPPSTTLAE